MSSEHSASGRAGSAPRGAVFLSYAREDAGAARRIAEALRASGLEVWFDENELRGGDAWDAKIRQQIDACSLFLPVISAHTQGRSKGYFRLEWKLAVDQTHLLAEGIPFIAPVVIDDTREHAALVPAEFMKVQWTHLPGALPTPDFVGQVQRLLAAPPVTVGRDRRSPPGPARDAAGESGTGVPTPRQKGVPGWTWGALTAVVVGVAAALFVARPPASPVPAPPVPVPEAKPPDPAPAKSIAVLPFANLSTDKENEFFADGVQDDVITNLAKIRDLTVISRTSTLSYRDAGARNLRKIAAELHVATVLEGSVRRVGNQVHMNAQLIDARSDAHLWADTFDGDASDIFALQARLAQQIAAALKATLTGSERALIERRPTQDAAAYELFLRGRMLEQGISATSPRTQYDPVVALYEQALARDPDFSLAHVQLAIVYGQMYWFGAVDPTPERRARARAELEAAQRLAPGAPEIRYAQGAYAYLCENDWAKALEEFQAAEAGLPNDAQLQYRIGITYRRLGRWLEALPRFERSAELSPHDLSNASTLVETLHLLHRFTQLNQQAARLEAMFPDSLNLRLYLVRARFATDGDRDGLLRAAAALPLALDDPAGRRRDFQQAMRAGDLATAERLLADARFPPLVGAGAALTPPLALTRAEVALLRGQPIRAKAFAEEAIAGFHAGHWSPRQEPLVRIGVARARLCAGLTDEGLRGIAAGVAEVAQRDQMLRQSMLIETARTVAAAGRREEALATLRDLLARPCDITPNELRLDPYFAGLRDDPRFEEVLRAARPL